MPLTGKGIVDMIITELAVFKVSPKGLVLVEKAKGISIDTIREKTDAPFEICPHIIDMQQ